MLICVGAVQPIFIRYELFFLLIRHNYLNLFLLRLNVFILIFVDSFATFNFDWGFILSSSIAFNVV